MSYNILIIDTNQPSYIKHLTQLDNINIIILSSSDDIEYNIINKNIGLIIINQNVVDIQVLEMIYQNISASYLNIPILALYIKTNMETSSLVYDTIDLENNLESAMRKIKFCLAIYKKEQLHNEHIEKLLFVDNLTKFPNRMKLIEDIKKDESNISSIAIIDINEFKNINDFYGLKIGDHILQFTTNLISETIGYLVNKVSLYKFSADVYCLVNKDLSDSDFETIITIVLGAIENVIYTEGEYEIDIKATAGITFSSKKNKLITADLALQHAKKNNKDYVIFFDELDNVSEYKKNMEWTKKLKYAMDNDNIVVYYQPLVNNTTLNVDKYECLVRMKVEDKIIAPFFFLEIAKKANKYKNLTKIIITKAFEQFEHLPFEFSLNVSYEDVEDKMFLHLSINKLKKYKVAKRVTWEILEDEGIKDYNVLLNFIKNVKELGCKVSIDDFGSGYSNFEHLLKMNVDYLKIDASLIKYVATDTNSYNVVKTVINFANSLNIKTISEYVENKEIYKITKELGSTYSQGYYFSAPIPEPIVYEFKNKG